MMDLARELANGVMSESILRSVAEHLDADWSEYLTTYGDPTIAQESRDLAYAKLLAIAPYRALIGTAVDIADREPASYTTVVPIGDRQ